MKKGFTIIEIILSISLIIVVGFSSFFVIKNKNNNRLLDDMSNEIYNAVHLFIETHEETKQQLYSDKNGVIIPLKKLELEGLIDFQDIDIDNEYVLTMLASDEQSEACNGNLYDIGTWTKSSNDIIYICGNPNVSAGDAKETLTMSEGYYIAKGENPNNWVKFDVTTDSSKAAYFSTNSELEDLWRIHSIDNDGKLKLVYNDVVNVNVEAMQNSGYSDDSGQLYLRVKDYYNVYNAGAYYIYFDSSGKWTSYDLIAGDENGKIKDLLSQINKIEWIEPTIYYFLYVYYSAPGEIFGIQKTETNKLKIGVLTQNEIHDTFLFNETYLPSNILGGYTQNGDYFGVSFSELNYSFIEERTYKNGKYRIRGAEYLPTIVLKNKVELKVDKNCTNAGSKECPYLLECSEC